MRVKNLEFTSLNTFIYVCRSGVHTDKSARVYILISYLATHLTLFHLVIQGYCTTNMLFLLLPLSPFSVVVDYVNKLFSAINNFFIRLPKDEIIHKVNFECISFERVPYFILYTGLTCSLNFLNLTFALFLLPSVSRDLPRYVHHSCTIIFQPIL